MSSKLMIHETFDANLSHIVVVIRAIDPKRISAELGLVSVHCGASPYHFSAEKFKKQKILLTRIYQSELSGAEQKVIMTYRLD